MTILTQKMRKKPVKTRSEIYRYTGNYGFVEIAEKCLIKRHSFSKKCPTNFVFTVPIHRNRHYHLFLLDKHLVDVLKSVDSL